jgi:methyl-branched lipid omega-hydroxylase
MQVLFGGGQFPAVHHVQIRVNKEGELSHRNDRTVPYCSFMNLPVVPLADIDLSDPEFWTRPREWRYGAFQTLRNESPFHFFEERMVENSPIPPGAGYRALVRHDDIWHVSRNANLFKSGAGSNIGDLPVEINEFFGSMINMDDPKHFRLRSIVSKGFTPKEIGALEESVRVRSASVIDRMFERFPERECDFVREVAALMPLQIICDMMGIPESDEEMIFNWTNTILGVGDPEYVGTFDDLVRVGGEIFSYALALGEERLKNPGNDIASIMMNAVVDGERLTAQEFGSFFILLVVAGNETTRTAIGHGMRELTIHRDQRELWFNDFETHTKTAVEEIVRYATPVIHFRRTATQDTEINGQPIKEGEKVVMFYQSGNRDESVFTNPNDFDIRRSAQPAQVGFGAGGPHFCLGANLARREIAVMFDEIRRRVPTLEITSEPDYLQSSFINGIKRMNCAW